LSHCLQGIEEFFGADANLPVRAANTVWPPTPGRIFAPLAHLDLQGESGMSRNTLVGRIALVLLLCVAAVCTSPTVGNPALSAEVEIPFELVTKHILLKVRVNDSRPLSYILDTGATPAIIQIDRAKELGLQLHGTVGVGGAGSSPVRRTGSFVKGATFTLPQLPDFSQPVTLALPLTNLSAAFGHDVDGIIGTDFIKNFVVELDYQARLIKLHEKANFTYAGAGETLPIRFNPDGHPMIAAEVTPQGGESIRGDFLLDTGAVGLALFSPVVEKHHLLGPHLKTVKRIGAGGAAGQVSGQIGRVSELKIGRFAIKSPLALFSQDKTGTFANPSLVGNLGGEILSRFKIFLDYDHRKIILEPSAIFAESFDRAFSGLAVRSEGADHRTFRIIDMLENSPATEAGLKKEDLIVSINGTPAAELTLTKLQEMFERPGDYRLVVSRGERSVPVTLTPRNLL